jgi:hypothetical protein
VSTPQSERQKLLRRGFALGRQRALRPPTERNARVAAARRSFLLLSDTDRYAVLAEFAIGEGPAGMVRAAALFLGGAITIGRHMPDIYRVHFASLIGKEADKLAFRSEQMETLH